MKTKSENSINTPGEVREASGKLNLMGSSSKFLRKKKSNHKKITDGEVREGFQIVGIAYHFLSDVGPEN